MTAVTLTVNSLKSPFYFCCVIMNIKCLWAADIVQYVLNRDLRFIFHRSVLFLRKPAQREYDSWKYIDVRMTVTASWPVGVSELTVTSGHLTKSQATNLPNEETHWPNDNIHRECVTESLRTKDSYNSCKSVRTDSDSL